MNDDVIHLLLAEKEPRRYKYFDGNEWRTTASGNCISVITPIDGSVYAYVQAVTKEEVDAVIRRAEQAYAVWKDIPLFERVRVVKKAAEYIRQHADLFIETLVYEIGKTKEESASEVHRTADLIEYFAAEAQSMTGHVIASDSFPQTLKGKHAIVQRVGYGVVLAIGPFNYPINLTASKIAPALLMGNAVVFKPPTQGSISGLFLTEAFRQAGVPAGVLSCVTGQGKEIGDYIVSHPGIRMIAFTGSTQVGKNIASKADMTPLLFECGGNNAVIVLDDADVFSAAKEIIKGAFSYAGQRCTGIKYMLASKGMVERLIPILQETLQSLVVMGDPRSETTKLVGPMISEDAAREVETIIQQAVEQGAVVAAGGKRNGIYMEPTILTQVHKDMQCVKEEVFGPLLSCISVSSPEEAIEIINGSIYGLQASIFTQDEGTGFRYAQHLDVGTVQINGSPQRGPDHFPFMGIKASGVGVQGVRYSLEAMSRLQSVVLNNPR
jgi:glyceraldehyde-3-phosphate dehydrogenase (NADP+)